MNADLVQLEVEVIERTDDAVYVHHKGHRVWLPRQHIEKMIMHSGVGKAEIVIPLWLYETRFGEHSGAH